MRDRKAFLDAGRNDPHDLQQKAEHPYDFVSLPAKPTPRGAPTHGSYPADRWTGTVTLTYRVLSPLHVGSGGFDLAKERGLAGGDRPVRGIVRCRDLPVLPGASWKGAVRARFEAITNSRLGVVGTKHSKIPRAKIPSPLQKGNGGKVDVQIDDARVWALKPQPNVRQVSELSGLCLADALFGAMGYRGRVEAEEGTISSHPATKPKLVAPLESPVAHRLAKPGKASADPGGTIRISEVEGRKFYYDGPIVDERRRNGQLQASDEIDYVPKDATITVRVHLDSLTAAEVGALLVAAGWGERVGVVRFGGYKAVGLGKVELKVVEPDLRLGKERRPWWRGATSSLDSATAVAAAYTEHLIDAGRLEELHRITTHRRDEKGAP
ncbi:MAG: RAMP superfamily CRISPR-associated protein [Thermoanaerobaculia bacterium]|nr:RAMP superfamily CRISPR-associated protein [Thermoanaerobaculia bacterium]